MIDLSILNKAGILPTIIILGGISYVWILLFVLGYHFFRYLKTKLKV